MYISMLKNSFFFLCLLTMTGCACRNTPCEWHTPLEPGMVLEDAHCFPWWEELCDPLLTDLILQAPCQKFDIAIAYIELRGLQERSDLIDLHIDAEEKSTVLNEGLSSTGFINKIEQNEHAAALYNLLIEQTQIELGIHKSIIQLSNLLNYSLDCSYELLSPPQDLPNFPCNMRFCLPKDVVTCQRAEIEIALATLHADQETVLNLENIRNLKGENYQLINDLATQGLKGDLDVQRSYQELFFADNEWIKGRAELLKSYVNLYMSLH